MFIIHEMNYCSSIAELWKWHEREYECECVKTALVSKQMALVTHTRACLRCVFCWVCVCVREGEMVYCVCVYLFDVVEV